MSHRNIFYYDNRDNLTCVRDPDLGLTYYTYDAGNWLIFLKDPQREPVTGNGLEEGRTIFEDGAPLGGWRQRFVGPVRLES